MSDVIVRTQFLIPRTKSRNHLDMKVLRDWAMTAALTGLLDGKMLLVLGLTGAC